MEKFDFYKKNEEIEQDAKDIMNGSWGFCAKKFTVVLILALLVIGGVTALCILNKTWYVITISCFIGAFLLCTIYVGCEYYCLNLASKLTARTSDLFVGFKKIHRVFVLFIFKIAVFVFGLCLVVFFAFKFELGHSMSAFVLCQTPKAGAKTALKQSARLMKGNKVRLLKLRFKNLGWLLLCFTVIGAVWALPYLLVSKSIFYNDLKTDF